MNFFLLLMVVTIKIFIINIYFYILLYKKTLLHSFDLQYHIYYWLTLFC